MAASLAQAMGYVGTMAVEFFVSDGELLMNEMAPRPHNSGHYTLDACVTDQFEEQVRAMAGLPLGEPTLLSPVAMVNLLGDLWALGAALGTRPRGSPREAASLREEGTPSRSQDGAPDGPRSFARRGLGGSAGGEGKAEELSTEYRVPST